MLVNYNDSMESITPLISKKYTFIKVRHDNIILELIFTA